MDQLDSDQKKGIVPAVPKIFSSKPAISAIKHLTAYDKLEITQFLEGYRSDPSQYDNKKLIDLFHIEWIQDYKTSLTVASHLASIQLYQLIIDTGVVGEITNKQFLQGCFHPMQFSYTFSKYLFDLCPNRINLIPSNILLSFLTNHYCLSVEGLQLFWDNCPQLKNPDFLNSEIRTPPSGPSYIIDEVAKCITNGGYDGDLSSSKLEDLYKISFPKGNVHVINFLISSEGSLAVLRFLLEKNVINLAPIYNIINPTESENTRNSLALLDDIFGSINKIFAIPTANFDPTPESAFTADVGWYLNWWKTDVLGDVVSLNQFKTFIFDLFSKDDTTYWSLTLHLVEYLGEDFFSTLSSDQIFSFFNDILANTHTRISSRHNGLYDTFPPLASLLSFPSVANMIKGHCIHFTRAFLFQLFRWDCAELFLKLGELTMEDIWSNHSYDDDDRKDNGASNDNVFNLKTIMSSPLSENLFLLPEDFVDWLSYQSGTQEQLIKMMKSKLSLGSKAWNNISESLRRPFLIIRFSYHQQEDLKSLKQLQRELYPLPQRFLEQLNRSPLSKPQSMSWLQSFIVYTPFDYMNGKFTLKLWKNPVDGQSTIPFCDDLVGEETEISLSHIPVLIAKPFEYDSPSLLLEDIIQGVIMALLINCEENCDQ